MGMSTNVSGVRDLDGKFAKMIAAKLACEAAEVDYPEEVRKYFCTPGASVGEDEDYLRREMESVNIKVAVTKCGREGTDGWEVDLSKLPEGVKAIRFENSY